MIQNETVRKLGSWLLNIDWTTVPEGSEWELKFASLPTGNAGTLTVIGAAAVLLMLIAIYRRDGEGIGLGRRLVMWLMRVCVLAVALMVCFRPVLVARTKRIKPARFLVLLDSSASMSRADKQLPKTLATPLSAALGIPVEQVVALSRYEIAARLIERADSALVETLRGKAIVELYRFDAAVAELATLPQRADDDPPTPADERFKAPRLEAAAFGRSTQLGGAVVELLSRFEGEPIAGLLVISDGRSTDGPGVAEAMAFARQRAVPIWAVGVGNPERPRNVELRTLDAPPAVFQNERDPYDITATIHHQGYDGRPLRVVLERIENGQPSEVATQDIDLGPAAEPTKVIFRQLPAKLGEYRYRVRLEAFKDEDTTRDNQREATVQVKDSWRKVLLVSGGPTFEYRVVRNFLGRESNLELTQWLQSANETWNSIQNKWYWGAARVRKANELKERDPEKAVQLLSMVIKAGIDAWAGEAKRLLKEIGVAAVDVDLATEPWMGSLSFANLSKRYDVVILLDPDPDELDRDVVEALRGFVEDEGGGLLYIAGEKYAHSFMTASSLGGFVDLLPVVPALDIAGEHSAVGKLYQKQFHPQLSPEGYTHPVTRIVKADDTNRELWGKLPGMYYSFPVTRHKPHARVLLTHDSETNTSSEPMVLAAVHNYGPGNVVFLGVDETYRWRSNAEVVFQRFWNRTIAFLSAGKLLGGKRRARIVISRRDYDVGEAIRISVEAKDPNYTTPLTDPEIQMEVIGPELQRTITLRAREGKPGEYAGLYRAPREGQYQLHLVGFKNREYLPVDLQLHPARKEFADPLLDMGSLVALTGGGKRTAVGVGRVLSPVELQALPDEVQNASVPLIEPQPPNELWASPLVIGLIVLLLSIEWLIRKFSNLP